MGIYKDQISNHLAYVVKQIKTGESLRAICNELDLNYHAFYKKIKKDFPELLSRNKSDIVKKRMSESKWSNVSKETLIDLYFNKKMTYSEISKELNIAKGSITGLFKKYELNPKSMKDYVDAIWTNEKRNQQRQKCYNGEIGIHAQGSSAYRFTKPERNFASWCDKNMIKYERQFQIEKGTHRYDFLLTEKNIIVEIDGEFWHSSEEQKTKDKSFENFAKVNGYKIIRFTDKQIAKSKTNCFKILL